MIHLAVFCVALFAQPAPINGVCVDNVKFVDYRGCVNTGHNGEECANWMSVGYWGDDEFISLDQAAENSIGDHNYCRNPGGHRWGAWCYQKYRIREKIYCPVIDSCFNRPEDDPKCPGNQSRKKVTIQPKRAPEISIQYVNLGERLTLICKDDCTGTIRWISGPQLTSQITSSTVTIAPVIEATAGDWKCMCGGRHYTKRVNICRITWSECKQVEGRWIKQGTSHCSDETMTETCTPPDTEDNTVDDNTEEEDTGSNETAKSDDDDGGGNSTNDTDSGIAEARNDETEEEPVSGCTGSNCGFCNRYPVVCGILGFLVTAITAVAALFIRKSLKWRREARSARANANTTLETVLTGSQLTGSYVKRAGDPRKPEYAKALQLEQLLSQITQQRPVGMSCSTSYTNTLNLRQLREDGRLGRIKSREGDSNDDIFCQSFDDSEAEFPSHFGSVMPNNDYLREDPDPALQPSATIEGSDEYMPSPSEETGAVGSDEELGYHGNGEEYGEEYGDGTMFDRYYDEDVDRWSMEVETQI